MIFCLEDDDGIRDLMIYALNAAGFEAAGFSDGTSFWAAVKRQKPELVMLDIMLPGEDGISVLKNLRSQIATKDIPVIMATAKGTEYDKVTGLDLGADDYLAKPFGMMEMVSRVKAVLRRSSNQEKKKPLHFEGLEVDPQTCIVRIDKQRVELTLKEYKLLLTFMENVGRAFTRDQLLEIVWGLGYIGETRTVDVHIGTLRTKLGKYGSLISTVRGIGYRMEDQL